jgi:hypothetical protein
MAWSESQYYGAAFIKIKQQAGSGLAVADKRDRLQLIIQIAQEALRDGKKSVDPAPKKVAKAAASPAEESDGLLSRLQRATHDRMALPEADREGS